MKKADELERELNLARAFEALELDAEYGCATLKFRDLVLVVSALRAEVEELKNPKHVHYDAIGLANCPACKECENR